MWKQNSSGYAAVGSTSIPQRSLDSVANLDGTSIIIGRTFRPRLPENRLNVGHGR